MRIDYEARKLRCAVGELSQDDAERRIGGDRGEAFRRMWIGRDIHERRASELLGSDPDYKPEVFVTHKCEVSNWEVTIAGRIDGLTVRESEKRVVVEEVKSLHFELELASLLRSDKLHRHLFQLLLYSYFLSRRDEYAEFTFAPQLALIDLVTGATKVIDAEFDRGTIESTFLGALRRLVDQLESERALRLAKSAWAEEIEFPFGAMRPFQEEMIDAVGRAVRQRETLLVSAPTGVGKTIGALYPALRESLRLGKKLFFLTPKTLQQDMAVRTLEAMNDGTFRVLRIRAKKKMCAHTEVICHEDFCPFARGYGEKMTRSGLTERIVAELSYFDPDVVFERARDVEVCPFEVSLELLAAADVVVCDYNYVFDPYIGLRSFKDEDSWDDAVFVVDEAHNLLDRARGYYSPEIDEAMLQRVFMHLSARHFAIPDGWEDMIDELRDHLRELARPFEEQRDVKQVLCEPDVQLLMRQRLEWERLVLRYVAWKIENKVAEEDDPVIDFYYTLVRLTDVLSKDGEEFARIVEQRAEGLALKIYCLDPSRFVGEIVDSSWATIAMSATLEPFEFHRKTLGFPADRTAELSLPSPFPKSNRRIVVMTDVDTTYKSRAQHYDRITERIGQIAESLSGNVLALFPSYAFLQEISMRSAWMGRRVFVQQPDMTEYERKSILDALSAAEGPCLVLAVSGGMYAEGIDYAGEMLSAVCIVGPSLPAVTFEQELLKRYFDEQYAAGFEYAYLIPGMTRVVQSAGRVIRSERDIGVIALLCKRFASPMYTRYFPADWYDESPRELVTKNAPEVIRRFFEERSSPQLRLL